MNRGVDHSSAGRQDTFGFRGAALFSTICIAIVVPSGSPAAANPQIRLSASNVVPQCVTAERLTAFLVARNPRVEPRFRFIAQHYKRHGEALRVRWDYAFFQMLLETNYLSFRRPDGSAADVSARQNNFAGLGATGGGVPGDSLPDVSTGVLAQLQHLVAYSGERVANPVAPRTRLKQDDIVSASASLRRPVRFSDLTRRWAADSAYHRSIESIATAFRSAHCDARAEVTDPVAEHAQLVSGPEQASRRVWDPPSSLGGEPQLRRETRRAPPSAAIAPIAQAQPFKTVWQRSAPGDMPPLAAPKRARRDAAPKEAVAKIDSPPAPAVPVAAAPSAATTAAPANVATIAPVPTLVAGPEPVSITRIAEANLQAAASSELASSLTAWSGMAKALPTANAPKPASSSAIGSGPCRIVSAPGAGDGSAVLVRTESEDGVQFTVIAAANGAVLLEPGSAVADLAGTSTVMGSFAAPEAAIAKAKEICPGARLAVAPGPKS